jgi:DNA-binding NtrC family response regulator
MNEKILIADDEENIRYTFTHFLDEAGYQIDTASTLSQCIKKMQQGPVDLLFLDLDFGDDYGLEAIHGLKCIQPDCAIVVITGSLCAESISKARKSGAVDYLVKPIHQQSLLYIVKKTLAQKNKLKEDSESADTPLPGHVSLL